MKVSLLYWGSNKRNSKLYTVGFKVYFQNHAELAKSICEFKLSELLFPKSDACNIISKNLWRIQEFQNQGARSRRGRILGSGVCFDARTVFFSENSEQNTYGKHCLSTSIKV